MARQRADAEHVTDNSPLHGRWRVSLQVRMCCLHCHGLHPGMQACSYPADSARASGAYLTFEADAAAEAAADSATGSHFKDETKMPESATSS